MDRPAAFEGILTVYGASVHRGEVTPGWRVAFATQDGQPVPTVSKVAIHLDVEGPAWAELTMFADADGRPILTLPPGPFTPDETGLVVEGNGYYRERTFAYLIEFITEPVSVAAQ